jgi:hypothetical protein
LGDLDKIIGEEEEYEVEDADDLTEQKYKGEYEDKTGENTAARERKAGEGEEGDEEVEGRIEFTYSKKEEKKKERRKEKKEKTKTAESKPSKKKLKKKSKKKPKKTQKKKQEKKAHAAKKKKRRK